MKFIEEVKHYPKEVKFFHVLFLISIILYVIAYFTAEWHVAGYFAYACIFVGALAATTGFMHMKTGSWKFAAADMILFIAIILIHYATYPY